LIHLASAILGGSFVIAAAWLAGRAVAPQLAPSLSYGIGAILVSYVVFLLMAAHEASRSIMLPLLAICMVAGLLRRPHVTVPRPPWAMLAVCVPFGCWYVVNALTPEVQADANVYHLQPAVDSLRYRGFTPFISFYDRLPNAIEMLFVPAWRVGASPAAKLVHFSFLLATLPVIVHLARRLGFEERTGHFAAALYFCTPIVGISGTSAFNDAALVYFTLAAIVLAQDDEPVFAGLAAGFCYAIKMTGLLAVPAALAFFLARRQWKRGAVMCAAAGAALAPWVLRNWIETGNPFAPFFNRWFPNRYFLVSSEQRLSTQIRSYGVSFWQRFPELLVGYRLHGILGPMFVLAPLALLAIRRRPGLVSLALAAFFAIPWWMNAGTRFLMPTLPFVCLALCSLPFALVIVVLHAITSWPAAVSAYSPHTFQIYPRRSENVDATFAKFVQKNTPADARIFDMTGIHKVLADRELISYWGSAHAWRLLEGLEFARQQSTRPLAGLEASFNEKLLCGFRAVRVNGSEQPWNVHAMEVSAISRSWTLMASKRPWEAPLAFDRNPVSRWSTDEPAERGDFLQADFSAPALASSIRLLAPDTSDTRIEICTNGRWQQVATKKAEGPELNLKPAAVQMLKSAGFTHIVAQPALTGVGALSERLVNEADHWGLEVVGNAYTVYVLRLR
jgi:hypothetical protein